MHLTQILAPVDLSEGGITALQYARLFAEAFSANLTVMYVDPLFFPVDVTASHATGAFQRTCADAAFERTVSDATRTEVRVYAANALANAKYDVIVESGQPVHVILRTARELNADLLVMGTHALRGWRRAVLGSVTEGVLHGTAIPILTVSRSHGVPVMHGPVMVTRIVCPVNFTDGARESLRYAAFLAEKFNAELVAVHVIEPGSHVLPAGSSECRVREWIGDEVGEVMSFRELTMRGGAAERVLDCIDDLGADLLVIGAQHKFFRETTVIGTTTERLVRFAPCPVLTVVRAAVPHEIQLEEAFGFNLKPACSPKT
ncbi:MAG TPA: universal stress protein [Thermoanaerobaculia bacterium]